MDGWMDGWKDRWTDGRMDGMPIEALESGCYYVPAKFYLYIYIRALENLGCVI